MVANLFDLTGKKALVTGANSGIGLGFATGLAKCGADVVIWGRRCEDNERAAKELSQYGTKIISRSVDVSSEEAVVAGMADAVDQFGRLDIVISNAGIAALSEFHQMSAEDYHGLLNINQHGGFFTLREAVKHMKKRADEGDPGGSLIVCGSLSIDRGQPYMAHYGAAKAALAAITKSIAVDYGKFGIRANVVAPGSIYTGFMMGIPEDDIPLTKDLKERNPAGRWGYPADVEGIAAYLASDAAAYHTGDVIVIDGGQSALI